MKQVFAALLALVISGCATMGTGNYGSFLPEDQKAVEVRIAHDAVDQLIKLYPPAKSRFNLKHEAKRPFGVTLVTTMRREGYAVEEYAGQEKNETDGHSLRYVLDVAGAPDFYRLTMMVGDQSISRPYMRQGSDVVPAGYWARKE